MTKFNNITIVIFILYAISYIKCADVNLTSDQYSFVEHGSIAFTFTYPKAEKDESIDKVEIKLNNKIILIHNKNNPNETSQIPPDGFKDVLKEEKFDLAGGSLSFTLENASASASAKVSTVKCIVYYFNNDTKGTGKKESDDIKFAFFDRSSLKDVKITVQTKDGKDSTEFHKGSTFDIGCTAEVTANDYEMTLSHEKSPVIQYMNKTVHKKDVPKIKSADFDPLKDTNNTKVEFRNAAKEMEGTYECEYRIQFKGEDTKDYAYSEKAKSSIKITDAGSMISISYSVIALILISTINSILK